MIEKEIQALLEAESRAVAEIPVTKEFEKAVD
jgi:arabinose-5-phosphate isomerase